MKVGRRAQQRVQRTEYRVQQRVQRTEYRVQKKALIIFSVLCFLFSVLCGCQQGYLHKDSRVMMGTFVRVASCDKRAAGIVFDEIKRVEMLLSKYRPESDVSRLNRLGNTRVSADTIYVLAKAQEFWLASEGAFDITVGPLVALWGFTDKKYRHPEKKEISQALKSVGMDKIIFNNADNVVQFKVSGMEIDLGAIAKGYAVDCAVDKLKKAQVKSCLVAVGGDIYCLGDNSGRPWRVAIQDPRRDAFIDTLDLQDRAISTSGDYEQFFYKNGRRFAHIFDPKTGYPASSKVVSATVVAGDCLTADAVATSIFVLGKIKGEELIKNFPGVQVRIIEGKGSAVSDTALN